MSSSDSDFNLTAPEPAAQVKPKEPLYSMLIECPEDSLKYLYGHLMDYQSDAQLSDEFPEVGLTRKEYIEQVHIALNTRQINY